MTNWHYERLGEVLQEIKTGSTPPTSRSEYFNGSIPWFTPGDIGDNRRLIVSNRYLSEQAIEKGEAKLFDKYTLLVTCIGEIGRVGVLQIAGSSNQQITALKFKENVDVDFAYYWFIANKRTLERQANQAIVPILNNDLLKRIEFSYPSLPEQQRIAAILAKADRLRRLRRYALDLGESYLQSVFLEMFGDPVTNTMGWKLAELDEVCDEIYRYPTFYGFDYTKKGTPVVRIGNILLTGIVNPDLSDYVFIDPKISARFPRTILELLDTVMAVRGDGSTATRIGLVNSKNLIGANISPNLIRFKANPKILHPLFLYQLLVSDGGQELLDRYVTRTAKKTITATDIKAIKTIVPSLTLQQKFAQIVHKHERLSAQQCEAARQAEHLFQTLLHRAFAGEL